MKVFDIEDTKKKHWIGKAVEAVEVGVFRYERRTVVDGPFKGMVYYLRNGGQVQPNRLPPEVAFALDEAVVDKWGEW
jgi:hypothetical protein